MNFQISTSILLLLIAGLLACQQDGSSASEAQVTPGGYAYEVHLSNDGPKAQTGDWVYFNVYWRNDDTIQMSSVDRGQQPFFQVRSLDSAMLAKANPVEQVVPVMSEGDSLTITIPLDTLPSRPPGFEQSENLYMDIKLVDIKSNAELEAEKQAYMADLPEVEATVTEILAKFKAGNLGGELQSTESGLEYVIHEEGSGPKPRPGQTVSVSYYGVLPSGEMFDNSYKAGRPIQFPLGVGQVIRGWDEGLALLPEGTEATLFIPAELGYGAQGRGSIPANSDLIFHVVLEDVGGTNQ
jgi:FKBP-type peptidyl-prolyl cis-trans isomerase FkpA